MSQVNQCRYYIACVGEWHDSSRFRRQVVERCHSCHLLIVLFAHGANAQQRENASVSQKNLAGRVRSNILKAPHGPDSNGQNLGLATPNECLDQCVVASKARWIRRESCQVTKHLDTLGVNWIFELSRDSTKTSYNRAVRSENGLRSRTVSFETSYSDSL